MTHETPGGERSLDWRRWMAALGPGAIIASLTIGTGELVFSTRAGALFGYRVIGIFACVLLLKWALVYGSAWHWVHSDEHPLRCWRRLPGPSGWLPMTLLLLAVPAFPVWVSFHAGTLGTLAASVSGTAGAFSGNASLVWAAVLLAGTLGLSATGGYARQERFQAAVVALMLASVLVALVMLKPDVMEVARDLFTGGALRYPDWALRIPEFRERPVWVEFATYAGVVGGSGYDYLAYVAWLRDKHGSASERQITPSLLRRMVAVDGVVSFLTVLLFSAVFVVCGTILLGPKQQVPTGSDLLTLQAQFVAVVGDWLKPLYFSGAFLALAGTLYGTMEVAPAVLRELWGAIRPGAVGGGARPHSMRRWGVGWSGIGGLVILMVMLGWRTVTGAKEPFQLVAWVTPANLFTGVLACGWISALNVWTDRRFSAPGDRMPAMLTILNAVGAGLFCVIGMKAVWDQGRWLGLGIVAGSLLLGMAGASWANRGGRKGNAGG